MRNTTTCMFIGLIFSMQAFAVEKFYRTHDGDHYLLTYFENEVWQFSHILVPRKGLQESLEKKIFKTKQQVDLYLLEVISKNRKSQKSIQFIRPDSYRLSYVQTETKDASLWKVKNTWTLEWETKYASWLEDNLNKDFFVDNNLATDCADAAYALRWIFARDNNLPAANTLAGSHVIFSHESMKSEWKTLPTAKRWQDDKRFLAALNYLLEHAYTGTLRMDGYPIEMSREAFLVGTIHLTSGHAMIVSKIDYDATESAPIWKLSSTVPSEVRVLYEEIFLDKLMVDFKTGGLLRFRWPIKKLNKWALISKIDMPYYSLEQYEDSFRDVSDNFALSLIQKLGIDFSPEKILKRAALDALEYLKMRVEIVEDGFDFCKNSKCDEGSENYEAWSTPSRDKRLKEKLNRPFDLAGSFTQVDPYIHNKLVAIYSGLQMTVMGVERNLSEYRYLFNNEFCSSHPEDSLASRWAVDFTGITATIKNSIDRTMNRREELLKASNTETYKSDQKFKKAYLLHLRFCQRYGEEECKKQKYIIGERLMSKMLFFTSNSKHSMDQRWGRHIDLDSVVALPLARDIIKVSESLFILDKKLFDTKTNSYRHFPKKIKEISYNDSLNIVLGISTDTVYLLNLATDQMTAFNHSFKGKKLQVAWIDRSFLALSNCATSVDQRVDLGYEFAACSLHTFEVEKNSIIPRFFDNKLKTRFKVKSRHYITERNSALGAIYISEVAGRSLLFVRDGELVKSYLWGLKPTAMITLPDFIYLGETKYSDDGVSTAIHILDRSTGEAEQMKGEYNLTSESVFLGDGFFILSPKGNIFQKRHLVKKVGNVFELIVDFSDSFEVKKIGSSYHFYFRGEKESIIIFRDGSVKKIQIPKGKFINSSNEIWYFQGEETGQEAVNLKTGKVTKIEGKQFLKFCEKTHLNNQGIFSYSFGLDCSSTSDDFIVSEKFEKSNDGGGSIFSDINIFSGELNQFEGVLSLHSELDLSSQPSVKADSEYYRPTRFARSGSFIQLFEGVYILIEK